MFGKKIQHEDSHEFPRILTVWSYKYDLSIISSLFDPLETLTLVTIGQESSKSVYFPADVSNRVHRIFYFLKHFTLNLPPEECSISVTFPLSAFFVQKMKVEILDFFLNKNISKSINRKVPSKHAYLIGQHI